MMITSTAKLLAIIALLLSSEFKHQSRTITTVTATVCWRDPFIQKLNKVECMLTCLLHVRADYQGGSKMPAYTCYVLVHVQLALFLGSWEGGEVRICYILTCTRVHVNHISLACTSIIIHKYTNRLIL